MKHDSGYAWLSLLVALAGPADAMAQDKLDAVAPANDVTEDDIVVTANKRTERLQDVPISVSAIGGSDLERTRVSDAADLQAHSPNLQANNSTGRDSPIFALRGVSMSDFSLNQNSPVASYFDEVYRGNFALLGVSLFDIERVEILRGPQGTLYGKNTTGGAINIVSRRPELSGTSGEFEVGAGNFGRLEADGAINVPLGEKVAARFAFTAARADGFFENLTPRSSDLSDTRKLAGRFSLLVEPSSGARFILRASASRSDPHADGIFVEPADILRPGLQRFQIEANATPRRQARAYSVALNSEIDISPGLMLTSVTSWDKGRISFLEDADGRPTRILELGYESHAEQFAQDTRLTSDFDGPFNFIAGLYFNHERIRNGTELAIGADTDFDGIPGIDVGDCLAGFPAGCLTRNSFEQSKKSLAAYADTSFELNSVVRLRGGLRFTSDRGELRDYNSDAFGVDELLAVPLISNLSSNYSDRNWSGRLGIDLHWDDLLAYGAYSVGYRGPSFNAQAFFDPSEVTVANAEDVNAWEVGIKSQWLDRRITFNAAAFHYDYKNQQYLDVDSATGAQILVNLPRSEIYGVEAEFQFRINPALSLRSSLGLLKTEIKQGVVRGIDIAGSRLPNAPALSASAGVDWTFLENAAGVFSVSGQANHWSRQFYDIANTPGTEQSAFSTVNAQIRWESAGGGWRASAWAKNILNAKYFTLRVDLEAGGPFRYNRLGDPPTYGITIGRQF